MREQNSRSRFPFNCSDSPLVLCSASTRLLAKISDVSGARIAHELNIQVHVVSTTAVLSSFLLPGRILSVGALCFPASSCYAFGLFRERNANSFAQHLILRFTCQMIRVDNADSKLCAEVPRHATENFLSEISAAQLGKGQGSAPPRCIPSHMPLAAAETVPVSAPSARCAVVAFAAWAVCP
jgi:hypothetical protein